MITLKGLLRLNAASCIGFGALFVFRSSAVASFLSPIDPAPAWVIMVLGGLLSINGLHLLWVAHKANPSRAEVLHFSIGDLLWVVGTLLLLGLGVWVTSPTGIAAALLVAAFVGALGALQWRAAPRPATRASAAS